jgi:hypothetical protein
MFSRAKVREKGEGLLLKTEQREALGALQRNPYWGRHWIAQEVILSRKRSIWYGNSTSSEANYNDITEIDNVFYSVVQDSPWGHFATDPVPHEGVLTRMKWRYRLCWKISWPITK